MKTRSVPALLCLLGALSACRVTTDEIQGWARKASGPRKLVAVLEHDKYAPGLRVDAALTLVTMKPRAGRNIGLQGSEDSKGLLVAFQEMAPPARATVIRGLAEPLARGVLQRPNPAGDDPSIPYKDAAYALLTHDDGSLVSDPAAREHLRSALVLWCRQDFTARFDNTAQLYGMEQVLRLLRDEGVAPLTTLLAPGFTRTRELSDLVRELGSNQTKLMASTRLADAGRVVEGPAFEATTRDLIKKRNQEASIQVDALEFEKQVLVYRAVETERLFSGMKAVGGKPAVDYLLGYAENAAHPAEQRILALAALEGHIDRNDPAHAAALLRLIESDSAPDTLRDLALRRAGDLPYEQIAPGLYRMFSHRRWKVRWVAASLALRMADAKHLPEFMQELGKIETMTMGEALTYGGLLPSVRGVSARELAQKYGAKRSDEGNNPVPVRLAALSYYYEAGTPADLPSLQELTSDGTKVPPCPPADGPHADPDAASCSYICSVNVAGTPTEKEIGTVGQFVEYCLLPAIESRQVVAQKPAPAAPPEAGKTENAKTP
jgi:HEAT repeat protein